MGSIYSCIRDLHDPQLLVLAAAICVIGVYASFGLALHAGRSDGAGRTLWSCVGIMSSACTAWATHMIALLAFRPGMDAAFDPFLTFLSLSVAILGIAIGMLLAMGRTPRRRRFAAGLVMGAGIAGLHYLGQASYLVRGTAAWDLGLVALSLAASLPLYGLSMVVAGDRVRSLRNLAAPLLLLSIAVLHLGGMAAIRLTYDPSHLLPTYAISPEVMAPVVAAICVGLIVLAILGLRFTLNARAMLRRDGQRLRELANLALEGLAICDEERITSVNESLERLSGFSKNLLNDRSLSTLLPGLSLRTLPEREERDAELLAADGQLLPVRVLRSEVHVGSQRLMVVAVRDQRERLRTEEKIRTLAFTDPLTGLANRSRFNDLLAFRLGSCREHSRRFALLMLDLDRFKAVNDTLGHGIGDELLRRVAGRLRKAVRSGDLVARLGGDEFAVLVDTGGEGDTVRLAAENIVELIGRPFVIEGQILELAASVGIALAPDDGEEASDLCRNADLALYRAKQDGGGAYRYFEAGMNALAQERRALEFDLRRAIAREELEVHYQPQVNPRSGHYEGAEALVRWRHPERGMISPAEFIPLAEEVGLICGIGEWVLRTACAEAAGWPEHLCVAVNLSALQFRDRHLAVTVAAILEETGLSAQRLELEVTESAFLQDDEKTYAILHSLRDLGIRISMDDFGTGYSSLGYLRRFPFDKLKIDQSFVRQVPDDADSVAIVQAIASLGAKLRMKVTVEGVETADQRALAVMEGCDQIQGFLISRPVPAETIQTLFEGSRDARATA